MTSFSYRLIAITSVFLGATSLIVFLLFVLLGPLNIIQLNATHAEVLLLDAFLSVVFFTQHSSMVRQPIKQRIIKIIPSESFYAIHSIISGTILLGVTILWQESPVAITTISKPYNYLLFFLQFLSILGLIWGVKSLKEFDPFGRKQIANHLKKQNEQQQSPFVYKGPYHYVRHPFYFFMLVMIWTHHVITADRLLFIFLWTGWIIVGTFLEEKDLVNEIGDAYRQYQKKVPMLIPYKIFGQLIK